MSKKISDSAVKEIRRRLTDKWEPRDEISTEFGIEVSHVYSILRNESHYDPQYSPKELAKRPRITRWTGALLTPEKVKEIREYRLTNWASNRKLSEVFNVPENVVIDCLSNKSYYDPGYNPEKLLQRDRPSEQIRTTGSIYGLKCACRDCAGKGVQYVGQTTQTLESRLKSHRSSGGREKYTKRGRWVRSHGPKNITIIELQRNPKEGLDEAEIRWIRDLKTLSPGGYNSTPGGYSGAGSPGEKNPSAKLTESEVREIIHRIGTEKGVNAVKLSREYGVSNVAILNIDAGRSWSHVDRPYGTGHLKHSKKDEA